MKENFRKFVFYHFSFSTFSFNTIYYFDYFQLFLYRFPFVSIFLYDTYTHIVRISDKQFLPYSTIIFKRDTTKKKIVSCGTS